MEMEQVAGDDPPAGAAAHGEPARMFSIPPDRPRTSGHAVWPEDSLLVSALRRREESAFAALLDRHGGAMMRLAAASLSDWEDVQDVVQEAWIGVLKGIDRFEERCTLKTWIFRILQNRIRTRLKRRYAREPLSAVGEALPESEPAVDPERFLPADHPRWPHHWKVEPAAWSQSPDEVLLSDEVQAQFQRAVAELPALQRSVITMRDVEGWEADEVCDVLNVTPINQRVLLHRARSKVRQALENYFRTD